MSGLDDLFGKGGLSQAVTAAKAQAPEPEAIDAEPAAGLARELGVEGKVTAMGSNTSFLLSGPDRLWLLLQGGVDVFYVVDGPTESSQGIHGIRTHVARIEAGGAVFGIDIFGGGEQSRQRGGAGMCTTHQGLLQIRRAQHLREFEYFGVFPRRAFHVQFQTDW